MCPFAIADGSDATDIRDEIVPGGATVIHDVAVGFEDSVREPVFSQELPDILDGIQLGTLGGQRDQSNVVGDIKLASDVPARLINQE